MEKYSTVMLKDFRNKKGFEIKKGESVELEFNDKYYGMHAFVRIFKEGQYDKKGAVLMQNLHKWVKGATKPPSINALEKMEWSGKVKSVLGRIVEPDGVDEYGSPSWFMVMGII